MSRVTVVYLGGFGRSGSTLVERLLGAVPGWVNIGELVDLPRSVARSDELCGCGRRFSECSVWRQTGERAFGGWTGDVLDRLHRLQRTAARQRHLPQLLASGRPSPALVELRDAYARIYRAVAEVTGSCVIVDASKGPALAAALAGAPGVDLRVLNVVRDPRAVAWSWTRHVERPHTATQSAMWQIPVRRAAAQWLGLQLEMEAIARYGSVPSARLRFEDVVQTPIDSLVGATAALSLDVEPSDLPAMSDDSVALEPSHGLSGNPGRFRSGTTHLRPDDRWVVEMPGTSRAAVTVLTLPLLLRYGYPIAVPPGPASAAVLRSPGWSRS